MNTRCEFRMIVNPTTAPEARFGGGLQPDEISQPTSCPTCGRLFPLARQASADRRYLPFVELQCTRTDEHPENGEHWHETPGGVRIVFRIDPNAVRGMLAVSG